MKKDIPRDEIVRLLKYSELSYAKIAKRLDISTHTVERIASKEGLGRGMSEEWKDDFRHKWNKARFAILSAICILSVSADAKTVFVNSENGLKVRTRPTTNSGYTQILDFGTEVAVDGKTDDWLKMESGGYILEEFTQEENPLEYLGCWRITAYAETGYCCANGNYPSVGYTIACNSLDFGTKVYIDGVGVRTVEDRGPSWLGSEWLDLYLGDYTTCVNWGNQYRDVYLVKGKE